MLFGVVGRALVNWGECGGWDGGMGWDGMVGAEPEGGFILDQ